MLPPEALPAPESGGDACVPAETGVGAERTPGCGRPPGALSQTPHQPTGPRACRGPTKLRASPDPECSDGGGRGGGGAPSPEVAAHRDPAATTTTDWPCSHHVEGVEPWNSREEQLLLVGNLFLTRTCRDPDMPQTPCWSVRTATPAGRYCGSCAVTEKPRRSEIKRRDQGDSANNHIQVCVASESHSLGKVWLSPCFCPHYIQRMPGAPGPSSVGMCLSVNKICLASVHSSQLAKTYL